MVYALWPHLSQPKREQIVAVLEECYEACLEFPNQRPVRDPILGRYTSTVELIADDPWRDEITGHLATLHADLKAL